ncbi:TPA: M15 family peptidase [Candidatus Poribacteria bacterium]|nr:M15 family peptidase [Candidatus Poribacteria bacterium]
MIKLLALPYGLREIMNYYGDPLSPTFAEENLSIFQLPFELLLSWSGETLRKVYCHKKVGEAFIDALYEIKEIAGESYLKKYCLNQFGGCYNNRRKINSNELSTHAWGIAFDMCPALGPYGEPGRLPWWYVEAFNKRGFVNLWQIDGMHFQACAGY